MRSCIAIWENDLPRFHSGQQCLLLPFLVLTMTSSGLGQAGTLGEKAADNSVNLGVPDSLFFTTRYLPPIFENSYEL